MSTDVVTASSANHHALVIRCKYEDSRNIMAASSCFFWSVFEKRPAPGFVTALRVWAHGGYV